MTKADKMFKDLEFDTVEYSGFNGHYIEKGVLAIGYDKFGKRVEIDFDIYHNKIIVNQEGRPFNRPNLTNEINLAIAEKANELGLSGYKRKSQKY